MTTQEMHKALEANFKVSFVGDNIYLNGMYYNPKKDWFSWYTCDEYNQCDQWEWCYAATLLGDQLDLFHEFVETLQKEGRIK